MLYSLFLFQYIEYTCTLANEKMRENQQRIERFECAFENMIQSEAKVEERRTQKDRKKENMKKLENKKKRVFEENNEVSDGQISNSFERKCDDSFQNIDSELSRCLDLSHFECNLFDET